MRNPFQTQYYFVFSALLLAIFLSLVITVSAQTTAFNFQGRLNDGTSPANGKYDLQFNLYDAITGGNQVGTTLVRTNLTLLNGIFSTQLDFGASAFDGSNRFIEFSLRPSVPANIAAAAPNAYVTLGPRQQILSVPYSIKSLRSAQADEATHSGEASHAATADNATTAVTAANAQNLNGLPPARFLQQDGSGNVSVTGNLTQPLSSRGLPKAIAHLDRDGNITSCYSGITGASTGNCGFSITHASIGSYEIHFPSLSVNSLPVIVTTDFDSQDTVGTVIRRGSFIEVAVHYISNGSLTNAGLSVVVY